MRRSLYDQWEELRDYDSTNSPSKDNWKFPATTPGTVMSSSNDSHRRAYPSNLRVTSFNCSSVAAFKIRNRSAGKPIMRPSVSSRKTVRLSTQTLIAAGSTLLAFSTIVVFIVSFPQKDLVLEDQLFNLSNNTRRNALVPRQTDRVQPKLTFSVRCCDMNVGRFIAFI